MAAHPTWKGFIKVSLVTFPVKAYTVVSESENIHFNQLHAEGHSRIQYKKTCPIHGEVRNDEIVSGYEYSKGQYVIVDPAELDKLRTEDDKAITINTFIPPEAIDPLYYSGKTYYLFPDGPVGQKPYGVIIQAMLEEKQYAIAQVVMRGREQTVLLRPMDNVLAMSVLNYENRVTKPSAFADQAPTTEASAEELDMAKRLIEVSTARNFDFAAYKDQYTEKVTKLIEAKVGGEEVVAPPVHEQAQIINLMEGTITEFNVREEKVMPGGTVVALKPSRQRITKERSRSPSTS